MARPTRRSDRSRKANTKYTNDGWDKDTLRLLRESSESSNPTSVSSKADEQDTDDEFDGDQLQQATENADREGDDGDDGDDHVSIVSGLSRSNQALDPEDDDSEEVLSQFSDEDEGGTTAKRPRWKQPAHLHSKGIATVERSRANKFGVWKALFGPQVEDLIPMLDVKELWVYKARDLTLPSWSTLELARQKGWTRQSTGKNDEEGLKNQYTAKVLEERQKLRYSSLDETKRRHFMVDGIEHEIVLGPWLKQEAFKLSWLKPTALGQAWMINPSVSDASYHSGWLINLGEKPQHMAWCPYQTQDQYLAIACRSTPSQRESVPQPETSTTPAFAPSAAYPQCIQIWKFESKLSKANESNMDLTTPPRLLQILACNFGDFKQIDWAPEPQSLLQDESKNYLGMLTVVSTDGCVRIIRVPLYDSLSDKPICLEVLSSTLTLEPPAGVIYTCFVFASPIDLIVGTSSGHIQIYNLSIPPDLGTTPEPYYTVQIHQTYVMSLSVLAEEEYSHFLASTSAAGAMQLTDLRSPDHDTITVPRARLPTRNLVCNPHTRSFITTVDSSGNTEARGNALTTVLAHGFRNFYSTSALSKTPEGSGTATVMAGSLLHPYLLVGNSGGTVWAQNVVRRILPTGKRGPQDVGGAWVQKIAEYEWTPKLQPSTSPAIAETNIPPAQPSNTSQKGDLYHGPPVRPGISRMHHGFKPEKLDLSNLANRKQKGPSTDNAVQILYEEEQAVSAMAWNNCSHAASWCSIGWASGVVWITDLGHATE